MPTILQANGFRFFFYTNDHEPKHVHVFKGGVKVKVEIETLSLVANNGMKEGELKQALEIVKTRQAQFLKEWDEYFSE